MKGLSLLQKLALIQEEFKANKSKYNSFGKYNYRSAEDILEALKPFNSKFGVVFTINEELIGMVIKSTATIYDTEQDSSISVSAFAGIDLEQKGMQVPQAFGSASSYAKKYALGNLLMIDDTADPDATNTHTGDKPKMQTTIAYLNPNTESWTKAVEYLKGGGSIESITKKYRLSAENRQKLMDESV